MTRRLGCVAIIPARGGSRRIPGKNLAPLAGKPLIAHTIQAAADAAEVDAVFVSTDDPDIAFAAVNLGAEVIWRPPELATDEAPTEPALIHAVDTIESSRRSRGVEIVVMLQATSPLRGAGRIDEGVRLLRETGCDSVIGVAPEVDYYFLGDVGPGGTFTVGYDPDNRLRTQDIPPRYRETGAIYVMTRHQLMIGRCRMGGDMRALVMEPEESIDIDTEIDLKLCEQLMEAPATPISAVA